MTGDQKAHVETCTDCGQSPVALDLETLGGGAVYCERCYVKNGYKLPAERPYAMTRTWPDARNVEKLEAITTIDWAIGGSLNRAASKATR